jgi:hypothetical protein
LAVVAKSDVRTGRKGRTEAILKKYMMADACFEIDLAGMEAYQ